jgi:hypothetical protein
MTLSAPYAVRPIRFLQLASHDDWTIKVYSITAGRALSPTLVNAAMRLAFEKLDEWRSAPRQWPDHGAVFLIVHHGEGANYIILDWWVDESILPHHVWSAPLDAPESFTYLTPLGIGVCVWELEVLQFERQAWIDHVLARPDGPDIRAYFGARLNAHELAG